jgi:hypothetical protein
MTPSTRSPGALCEPAVLLRRCVSLAVLDAILAPEWVDRYYSFDGKWGQRDRMASMRDGCGDELFIAFGGEGVFIKGFAHEAPMAPHAGGRAGTLWPGMYEGVPSRLHRFLDEPALSRDDVTFCLWWDVAHPCWRVGVREFALGRDPDGSAEMLAIYDGRPETYVEWASEYYETDVPFDAVAAIYDQARLTDELLDALNPEARLDAVLEESEGWPYGRG